jgi:DNA repair exonuclease SbcCD nuclease subunit
MERTKWAKKPFAILCGDLHLRESTPTCRIDDFWKAQWDKMKFIKNLQEKFDCVVLCGGDVFDHWKPSPYLLSETINHLPKKFYTVLGNHDLPQHSMELVDKCGVTVLEKAGKLVVLGGWHFGQSPERGEGGMLGPGGKIICVWHHMTYISKPYPEAKGGMAEGILRKYPQFDLIVTGDNHTSFTVEYEGRRLVNPGNLTRQTADQINYQPRVALWYAEDNSIEWANIPVMQNVITREHIEQRQQRDSRIEAFITQLNADWDAGMSFESNLKKFEQANNIDKEIMEIIYKSIEQ